MKKIIFLFFLLMTATFLKAEDTNLKIEVNNSCSELFYLNCVYNMTLETGETLSSTNKFLFSKDFDNNVIEMPIDFGKYDQCKIQVYMSQDLTYYITITTIKYWIIFPAYGDFSFFIDKKMLQR